MTEAAVGAELTVDHHRPRAAGGTDDFDNLVYACSRCNQYKGDYWPTPEQFAAGLFISHPHFHDFSQHWSEDETTGTLEPLTATGAFHIHLLHLNRPQLIAHRLQRRAVALMQQRLQMLHEQIEQHRHTIHTLQQYITLLLKLSSFTPPSEE